MSIAVVDTHGELIHFSRMDGAHYLQIDFEDTNGVLPALVSAEQAEALLAEVGLPEDPAAYVKRVNALLV